ncbi:MAG: hypothetical protein ACOY5B_13610 [Spirochaetota bacterium]
MVKPALLTVVALTACSKPFVMKPKEFQKPVMVGPVRQIGGEKVAGDSTQSYPFATEIEILDTPVYPSHDWHVKQERKLDDKLTAASVYGSRDTVIDEMRLGSYVFNAVLFYLDKDWIQVRGHSETALYTEPERRYILNVTTGPSGRKSRFERTQKKARPERRPTRRRRR